MTIEKSRENRYHAEQPTGNGAIHGFGATANAAIAEVADKMKCPICNYDLRCLHCMAASGARAANAKLTPQQLSERGKRMVMAREAKRKAAR